MTQENMSDIKAILCGYYGKGNGGDEALLVSLLQMLPSQIKPIVLSGNPAQTSKLYGVTSCDRKSAFPILKALRASDLFIWGGGSLMQDATSMLSPLYYAGLMALAQQQGLKTIAWAQGIGPLRRSWNRKITKQVLYGCEGISVRDYRSAKMLEEWQIAPLIAPDPVWSLEGTEVAALQDLPESRVAVVLRSHTLLTKPRLEILTGALQDFQKATGSYIVIVPFQPLQDLAIAESLQKKLGDQSQILSLSDPRELKGLFRNIKMTIGMRLHSLIMAAAEGCPCFALSYDPKVSQLMTELNLSGWELENLPTSSQTISETWQQFYHHGQALNPDTIKSLQDRSLMHRDIILNCL
ncbi:polysaccharide pyruvyl transferase CsaB [Xenococcus sp. PCC 7305]|uniref:polysaccharide pyruvyl transferase CsaB n=1 Tax=Xenococcus sp. PCC 7305 TaxID=102125 RepID=UPI0002ABFCB8|nr:polysaccharide pyruvyl transferase CsaB [Xenococcus sp. PCC 7305]ELS01409.1 polysaccharide pyruvyl transferase CsaB [Xenococcus sp. PCC 7305]